MLRGSSVTAMSSSGQSSHSAQAGYPLPLPRKAHLWEGIHSSSGAMGPFNRMMGFLSLGAESWGCRDVYLFGGWDGIYLVGFCLIFVSVCKQRAAQQESCS